MKTLFTTFVLSLFSFSMFAQDTTTAFFPYPKADRIIDHAEATTPVQLSDSSLLISFFYNGFQLFMKDSAQPLNYRIKEDFFFKIDKKGNIIEIEDSRTQTNENTSRLDKDDLIELLKLRFTPAFLNGDTMNCKAALRFDVTVQKTPYTLKLGKNKFKILDSPTAKPFYAEYIREGAPHFNAIQKWMQKEEVEKGIYKLTLIDASFALKEMQQVEFNPFKEEKRSLLQQSFTNVSK